MRSIPEYLLERRSPEEQGFIWAIFVVAAIALFAGVHWHMRRKMSWSGQEAEALAHPAPKPRDRAGAGSAARRWIYKTDEEGRPRRFLSHGEAALWATLQTGKVAAPFALYAFLGAFLETAGPGMPLAQRASYFSLPAAVVLLWFLVVGAVYLYLVLSGGVMDREEGRRRGGEGDGGRA